VQRRGPGLADGCRRKLVRAYSRALHHTRQPFGMPACLTGSTREHAPKLCSACAGWTTAPR
jgi:hypothetical protein